MKNLDRDIVLEVRNLSKAYKLYAKPSDMAWELLTGRRRHRDGWALEGVSFDLYRGEVLGVIGSNGAGKSTLLRIIAGLLNQTAGQITVRGKLSAILELTTPFHGEYSGRENTKTALFYMGLSSEEVEERVHDVIEFSELASVIDNPVKTYSSGMQARLAFSTAIAVRGDLLLIDEALAAGDAYFVSKCLRYLEKVCRERNTSAVLVSHSMPALVRLCDRALYLRKGKLVMEGHVRDVASEYEKSVLLCDEDIIHAQRNGDGPEAVTSSGPFRIVKAYPQANGEKSSILYVGETAEVVIEYESDLSMEDVWVGLEIYSHLEGAFVSTLTNKSCRVGDLRKSCEMKVCIVQGRGAVTFRFSPLLYGAGLYFFHFSLFSKEDFDSRRMQYSDAILHQRYAGTFRVKHRDALASEMIRVVEPPLEVYGSEI